MISTIVNVSFTNIVSPVMFTNLAIVFLGALAASPWSVDFFHMELSIVYIP